MRAHVVVKEPEINQSRIQPIAAIDDQLIEAVFQSAEETLDASIHPGRRQGAALMLDPKPPKPEAKQARRDARLVIDANRFGYAELLDHVKPRAQQRERGFVFEGRKMQGRTRTMIDDAENRMHVTHPVALAGQVDTPANIARQSRGQVVPEITAQHGNVVQICLDPVAHRRTAHRVAPCRIGMIHKAPVEQMGRVALAPAFGDHAAEREGEEVVGRRVAEPAQVCAAVFDHVFDAGRAAFAYQAAQQDPVLSP